MAKEKKVSVREGKNKIRQTKEWKQFRKGLGDERKVDALTNKKLSRCWNLHHMRLSQDLEEYADLQPELFECLNRQSHDVLHFLYRYFVNDEAVVDRLRDLLERMKELSTKRIENKVK